MKRTDKPPLTILIIFQVKGKKIYSLHGQINIFKGGFSNVFIIKGHFKNSTPPLYKILLPLQSYVPKNKPLCFCVLENKSALFILCVY